MKTTLFVPVLNEIEGLKLILPRIKKEWVDEIIFIDGHSTDGTIEYLQSLGHQVILQKKKGIAAAYYECLEVAQGEIIIPFSPDNNSIPELLPDLIAKIKEGYDMVVVSRYLGSAKSEDDDLVTRFGNWMFTTMVNVLFRSRYTDVLVIYRAFRKDLFTRLKIGELKHPILEVLLCIRCAVSGLKTSEIAGDEPKRIGGVRKMRPLYNGSMILHVIVKEYFQKLFMHRVFP